ncbi:MAG: hypothetical protein ACI4BA_04240 [Prevotella sp.]
MGAVRKAGCVSSGLTRYDELPACVFKRRYLRWATQVSATGSAGICNEG